MKLKDDEKRMVRILNGSGERPPGTGRSESILRRLVSLGVIDEDQCLTVKGKHLVRKLETNQTEKNPDGKFQ